jgi:hypothetical protein
MTISSRYFSDCRFLLFVTTTGLSLQLKWTGTNQFRPISPCSRAFAVATSITEEVARLFYYLSAADVCGHTAHLRDIGRHWSTLADEIAECAVADEDLVPRLLRIAEVRPYLPLRSIDSLASFSSGYVTTIVWRPWDVGSIRHSLDRSNHLEYGQSSSRRLYSPSSTPRKIMPVAERSWPSIPAFRFCLQRFTN